MSPRADDASQTSPAFDAETRFRALVEHSADGVVVVDGSGCVRFANSAAAELLRKPLAALVGYEFGHPAICSEPVEILIDPRGDEPSVAELRAVEVEWEGQLAWLVNLRDVTLRQRQQHRISQLNSALRMVLEVQELIRRDKEPACLLRAVCETLMRRRNYLAACVVLHDGDMVRCLTESGEQGQPSSSAPAVRLGSFPPCCEASRSRPDEITIWQPSADACAGCGAYAACQGHTRLVTRIECDGEVFGCMTLLSSADQPRDAEELELLDRIAADLGRALRSMKIEGAQQRAEGKLRDTEARFQRLFEHSIDAIMIADESGRYRDVNPAACAMFGRTREQLLAMSTTDLFMPETCAGHPATRLQQVLANGLQSGTLAFEHPDGSKRVSECSAFSMGPGRVVSILRDATERRSLEEQLRQSQKMEAVGRLAGGIAHDFNNLLTAIISFAGFVRDETPDDDPRRADIGEVLRAADRASSLTRQLLAFSRRQPILPRDVDLNALLSETRRLLRRTLGEDVEFVTIEGESLWPVFIDPGQFEQVVMNLAVNARDAMPTGGRLTVETRNEPRPDPQLGPCVTLRIRDTGVGMSEHVKAHLFEPFFTTKASGKGTGLGLSMVYGLVTQAGGRISVDSEPGQGACFEIRLPRSRFAAARDPAAGPVSRKLAGSETILVVEDEPMVRRAAVRILRRCGYRVLEASGGREAVALSDARAEAIDLVLCDVVMPQMSGPETAAALTQKRPGLKVLFMTGYAENTVVEHGVLASGSSLLHKPFTDHALVARVRELVVSSDAARR